MPSQGEERRPPAAAADRVVSSHGGALLAHLLLEHGVRHVFGVPGGQTLALYDAISELYPTLSHVLVRDERTAGYAADAYARLSGRVGVCDATVGPGTAKLPSGLGEALGASVPVLALVSELPAGMAPHRYRGAASQAVDQATLLAPVTKWQATVPSTATMPALVRQAFREATSGRPGPVALLLPQDVLDGPLAERLPEPHPLSGRFGAFPSFRVAPDPADVAAAAELLAVAERPLIVAGGGALHSGAGAAVLELAERLGAGVATSLSGKGLVPEAHPLALGVLGNMGTPAAARALDEADVTLFVASKSGGGLTFGWSRPRPDQVVIQIDVDPAELGRALSTQVALLADARVGVEQLLEAAGEQPARAAWREQVRGLAANWRATRDAERASTAVPVAPQRVMGALEEALGDDGLLICDASLASGWGGVYLEQASPGRRMLAPRGFAGLGFAVPAAIGAAAAAPGRPIVALTGDGALGYCVGELATIHELGLPVTVVVLNNSSLGWIRWYRRITFGRGWEHNDFGDVAFADVARAFGFAASRVTRPDKLRAALRDAVSSGAPALVDVVTDTWQTPIPAHRRAVHDPLAGVTYGG
jgi:acetolactate synthase-1/2/3 large subunit